MAIEIYHLAERDQAEVFNDIVFENNFDHIHFLWREPALQLFFSTAHLLTLIRGLARVRAGGRALLAEQFARRLGEITLTFGVYDHLQLAGEEVAERSAGVALFDGYSVSSRKLFEIYRHAYGIAPVAETADGVDRQHFRPLQLERFASQDRPLVIGWVGNSKWLENSGADPKGLETIVVPAIDRLVAEGLAIEKRFADRNEVWRPYEEMPKYYSEIDVMICSSSIEGTPNPVLEAMSCGVAVISTDVGIVPEVFGERQREFIVGRDIEIQLQTQSSGSTVIATYSLSFRMKILGRSKLGNGLTVLLIGFPSFRLREQHVSPGGASCDQNT